MTCDNWLQSRAKSAVSKSTNDPIIRRHCELVLDLSFRGSGGDDGGDVFGACTRVYMYVNARVSPSQRAQTDGASKGNRSTTLNDSDDNLPAPHLPRLPLFIDVAGKGVEGTRRREDRANLSLGESIFAKRECSFWKIKDMRYFRHSPLRFQPEHAIILTRKNFREFPQIGYKF